MRNKGAYIWYFGGRIIPQIINLITNIILVRYLSPEDFGQIGILAIFISISTTLTDAGFGGSIIKEENISSIDLSTVFIYNLIVGCSLYLLLFWGSPIIEAYFKVQGLAYVNRLLCLVFVINAFSLIPKTILIRSLNFKIISIISVIGVGFASLMALGSALTGFGVYSLVIYQITYAISDVICLEFVTRYKYSFKFSTSSFKKLFSFGFYTTVCNILEAGYTNIMISLFGKYMNLSSAGYLYQAQKLETSATNSLAITINTVAFPVLTRIKSDRNIFFEETVSLFRNFSLFLFPIFWLIIVYGKEIIMLVFGKEWEGAGIYLSFLMIVGIFYVMESLTRNFIKSLGEVKILAKYTLIKRVIGIGIILACLLVSPFAMLYGYILSTFLGYLINIKIYSQIIKVSFRTILIGHLKYLGISMFILVICFCVKLLNNNLIELISVVSSMVLYYFFIAKFLFGLRLSALNIK
ncbi:MAG: oligosaccharide flippase family protein [Clostridia bacterium]|nr:oligosaccharide flippase family protein [Clostridia bacterium]